MKTNLNNPNGFTLIELLVVILIMGILLGISVPAYNKTREKAYLATHLSNLRTIAVSTMNWAGDNGGVLPSPQYPGDHGDADSDPNVPDEWDFAGTGTGLWLDGVVYYAVHGSEGGEIRDTNSNQGGHLRNTVFESKQSFKKDPTNFNWYEHSYAMNKDIEPDPIFATSGEASLTNKKLSRFSNRASSMLFIENQSTNIVGLDNLSDIEETAETRWVGKRVIVGFLDGSARIMRYADIPTSDSELEGSRFWKGIDPD